MGTVQWLVLIMSVVAFSLVPTVSVGLAAPTAPTAVVIVEGRVIPAVVGTIIKQGVLLQGANPDNAYCSGLDYEIRVELPAGVQYGRVDLAAPGCTLTVTRVEFSGTAIPARKTLGDRFGFAANAATQRRIWGRHAMYEYVNVITTLSHQDFTYDDDGASVWNPQPYSQYCWHDGFGWYVPTCAADTYLTGYDQVERWTYGDFRNTCCSGNVNHTLEARPKGRPGGVLVWSCIFGGNWPPGWQGPRCDGGRVY